MATSKIKITGDEVAVTFNDLENTAPSVFKRVGGLVVIQFFGRATIQKASGASLAEIDQSACPYLTVNCCGTILNNDGSVNKPCSVRIGTNGIVSCRTALEQRESLMFTVSYVIQ